MNLDDQIQHARDKLIQLIKARTGRRILPMISGKLKNAEGFPAWRDELIKLLRPYDLDKYLTKPVPRPDDEELAKQWEMDRAEVEDYLLDSIAPNILLTLRRTGWGVFHIPDPKRIFEMIAQDAEAFLAAGNDRSAPGSTTASAPAQPPVQGKTLAEQHYIVSLDLARERMAGRKLQELVRTGDRRLSALKNGVVSIVGVRCGGFGTGC